MRTKLGLMEICHHCLKGPHLKSSHTLKSMLNHIYKKFNVGIGMNRAK